MDRNIKIAIVFIEKDNISCECVCAVPDIKVGDYVQIFLNNAPTTGEVKELKEMDFNDMPNSVYDMKSVIRKVPNPNGESSTPSPTVNVNAMIQRNRLVTIVNDGISASILMPNAEIEAYKAAVGDLIFFQSNDGKKYKATIFNLEESANIKEPSIHVTAVKKSEKNATFYKKCQVSTTMDGEDRRVTLNACGINEETYILEDIVTHIGPKSFERTRKMKRLGIATKGVTIEPMAFSYNESLEEIAIFDEYASINVNCFDGCTNLKRVILPYSLFWMRFELAEYYGNKFEIGFNQGPNIIHEGVVYTNDLKAIICCVNPEIKEYRAPLRTETIYPHAFRNCRELEHFTGSPMMEKTGYAILEGCMNLRSVNHRFSNNYDVIFMFGENFEEDGAPDTVEYKDGSKRVFYMPKECKYSNLPSIEAIIKDADPETITPEMCGFIGDYYSTIHRPKDAIKYHVMAAKQGIDESYQKLVDYSHNELIGQEYFTVEQYDYAYRLRSMKPFFNMISKELPEYQYENMADSEILDKFMDYQYLYEFLDKLSRAFVMDTDLLNIGLNRIFMYTEDIHDVAVKRLFLRCARKIGPFESICYWVDELLEEVFETEEDYREFSFDILKLTDYLPNAEKKAFIDNMPESETKQCLEKAYHSCSNPGADSEAVFLDFLNKATETKDVFYEKCAVLSMEAYLAACWRDKQASARFKKMLELIEDKYNEGFKLLGIMLLTFKQNMKRSIPKRFFWEMAEYLYNLGLLQCNVFENLLGENVEDRAVFYYKYPEYFNLNDRKNVYMKKLSNTYVFIPGKVVMKPATAKVKPILYLNYVPDLEDGKLNLFLNPHEGVAYYMQRGLPIPEEFYWVPISVALSIMYSFDLEDATLFPKVINQKVTTKFLESTFDRR